jgi:DNA-directed RNA polymerase subunit L
METLSVQIPNEGHTVACLLRNKLLEKCEYASCVVKHPQDTFLNIDVTGHDCREKILESAREVQNDINDIIEYISKQ